MPDYLKCGLCGHFVKSSRKSDMIQHFKDVHKFINLPEWGCKKCPYESSSSEELREHILRSHKQPSRLELEEEHEQPYFMKQEPADEVVIKIDPDMLSEGNGNFSRSEDIKHWEVFNKTSLVGTLPGTLSQS